MKCEDYLPIIESYIDGELDGQAAQRVRTHLATCYSCQEFVSELRQEQEVYSLYNREVDITPAMWAAVRARIEKEKPARSSNVFEGVSHWLRRLIGTPRLSPALAAALIIATVGTTVVVMKYLNAPDKSDVTQIAASREPNASDDKNVTNVEKPKTENPKTENPQPPAVAEPNPAPKAPQNVRPDEDTGTPERQRNVVKKAVKPQPTPEQLVREAEQKYLSAIAILEKDVNRSKSKLDPMIIVRFEKAMVDIDNTIAETRRAVRENPDDPIALQYLLSAYAKKVDVLRDMARSN